MGSASERPNPTAYAVDRSEGAPKPVRRYRPRVRCGTSACGGAELKARS